MRWASASAADPMDAEELAFVYERDLKVVPTAATVLAAGGERRRAGRGACRPGHRPEPDQLPDGGARRAEDRAAPAAAHLRDLHHREPHHRRLRQGRGQGRGDHQRDDVDQRGGRKGRHPHRLDLRPRRRRLRRPERRARRRRIPTPVARAGPLAGLRHPARPGPALPAERRPQPAALRPGGARRRRAFHARSCTACAPTASPAARCCRGSPARIRSPILSHQARFSAPVFPGDVVTVDLWRDGKEIAFEARVQARNATVIRNGLTVLR